MELHELHVLQRQAGAKDHRVAIACAGMGGRAVLVRTAIAARRQHDLRRTEAVDRSIIEAPGHQAPATPLFHDEVEGKVLDEERCIIAQALPIERMQHRVARAVGRGTGTLDRRLAEFLGHAAERALVDLSIFGARERHAEMFKLVNRLGRIAAEILDRILVTQPVRPLHGVVHVPAPVVGLHVAECCGNAALRRHGVAAGREDLADVGDPEAALGSLKRGPQAGPTGANDDDVECMVGDGVSGHGMALRG